MRIGLAEENKTTHLGEDDLLRTQLAHQRLQFRSAYVVFERAQVELARRAVQHAHSEALAVFAVLALRLPDRHAVAGLVVRQQLRVDEGAVRVHLVELAPDNLVLPLLLGSGFALRLPAFLVRRKSHLCAERRLRLVDTPDLVACAACERIYVHTKRSLTFCEELCGPEVERHLRHAHLHASLVASPVIHGCMNTHHAHFDALGQLEVKLTMSDPRILFIQFEELALLKEEYSVEVVLLDLPELVTGR